MKRSSRNLQLQLAGDINEARRLRFMFKRSKQLNLLLKWTIIY